MKTAGWLFFAGTFFFIPAGLVYGILTDWNELVGAPAVLLTGGMSLMIGVYLLLVHKNFGVQSQDIETANIEDADAEYGFYSPWSWWPLVLGAGAALAFAGVAIGWWSVPFGAVIAFIGVFGWVYEYSSGQHAH